VTSDDGLDDDEQSHEAESFGRPFLGRALGAAPVKVAETHDHEDDAPGGHYRPYLLTGGRTGGGTAGVGIETVLVRDHSVIPRQTSWSGEMAMIIAACESPVAVAEVAARVGLPLGVVQVLTGDLVTAGVLLRSASSMSLADDVLFMERLIHGVAAL
jgi:hypothetical protein